LPAGTTTAEIRSAAKPVVLHKAVEQAGKTAVSGHRVMLKMPSRPLYFDRSSGNQMLPAHFCGRDGSDDIADSLDQFFSR
jgi:hypothetical protein